MEIARLSSPPMGPPARRSAGPVRESRPSFLRAGFDDLFLRAQRGVDRLVRRLRLGPPPVPGRRRLLVVQIDGLSRAVLEDAVARGYMPFLRRLLDGGHYRLTPMTVGLPTSTPAFQMAAMYGVQPDIPGFHYHDKRRRTDIHFPRAGHAAFVEADQAGDRAGILDGGSVYGCVFTGGAVHDLFSFSRLTRPRLAGLLHFASAFVVIGWVAAKCAVLTIQAVVRAAGAALRHPRRRREWAWLRKKITVSVWTREWFTFAVARDLYDGVPAIYVNFLDHDEVAHASGPRSRKALGALRAVDRSLRQIHRVLRRVPGYRYDLHVLSDHGQASCAAFGLQTGRRFEEVVLDQMVIDRVSDRGHPGATGPRADRDDRRPEARKGAGPPSGPGVSGSPGVDPGFEPYLDVREACQADGVRVVSAGPNAFVYFLDAPGPLQLEEIEARRPGLASTLSRDPAVGFVLARSAGGPVCFWRGQAYRIGEPGGPFATRDDREMVFRELARLMAMPSAGDLVVYGIGAACGDVSYINERGAHGGPSPEELHTFVIRPAALPWPEHVDHPLALYELFMRYRTGPDVSAGAEAVRRRPTTRRLARHPVVAAT
jgi:hypothetical protein